MIHLDQLENKFYRLEFYYKHPKCKFLKLLVFSDLFYMH